MQHHHSPHGSEGERSPALAPGALGTSLRPRHMPPHPRQSLPADTHSLTPTRCHAATMPRNRVCDVGFTAQVRVASAARHAPPDASSTLLALDAACRRASSIKAFALRLETVAERGEAVIWLAALRFTPTDRADASILALLRRGVPEARHRQWVDRAADSERVFVDYTIVPETHAATEAQRLQSACHWKHDSLWSASASPIPLP